MKEIRMFEASGMYFVRSQSSSRNVFFESTKQRKLAAEFVDRYLGSMLNVYSYSFSSRGWAIIFKSRSAETIKEAYEERWKKSKKVKLKAKLDDVPHMISEQFRIFNSQLVRSLNRLTGRKGSMVMQRLEKYLFETEEDFRYVMNNIHGGGIFDLQDERYRIEEKHIKDGEVRLEDMEYMNSSRLNSGSYVIREVARKVFVCFVYVVDKPFVIRKWIKSTLQTHFPFIIPKITPKLE